jgi:hypothetical protein
MQSGLIQYGHHFAKQHINLAPAFLNDRIQPELPRYTENDRLQNEHADEGKKGGQKKMEHYSVDGQIIHGSPPQSRIWPR